MVGKNTRINFNTLKLQEVANAFGVHVSTIQSWVNKGCPQNEDGTYCSKLVFKWKMDFEKEKMGGTSSVADLTIRKMEKEIEYKDAQIDKMTENVIDRNLHDQIMISRASSLRQFLEQTLVTNAVRLVGLSIDEARTRLLDLAKKMMEAYTGGEGSVE